MAMLDRSCDRITLLRLPLDPVDLHSLLARVGAMVESGSKQTIMYLNVHVANCAARDHGLRDALGAADLVYCDGAGIRLGAWLLGQNPPPRLTGADFIWDLAALSAERGFSLFWIGGRAGVARRAVARLADRCPGLEIAGTHHGFFAKQGSETTAVISEVNASRPDIVLVGLGTPMQESWVTLHRAAIEAPVVWCIGATADFIAGEVPRGPRWMVDNGLEWLHRLWAEPRRMWRRYAVGNPIFLLRILGERLGRHS
jgi:N-acetylglucosaminyldiphosphoundecaprenol N-acetyl-beta-D-mannosaminyltransferase